MALALAMALAMALALAMAMAMAMAKNILGAAIAEYRRGGEVSPKFPCETKAHPNEAST